MMTSTARRCSGHVGFTLLEIVIALLIACMIMAGAAAVLVYSSDQFAVQKASRELEAMAKRARMTAVLRQKPYALVFREHQVEMMPWIEASRDQDEVAERPADDDAARWLLTLDNGMRPVVRRWAETRWQDLRGDQVEVWRFDPNGLCEPIGVRLVINDTAMQMAFHPLTAAISESELQTP